LAFVFLIEDPDIEQGLAFLRMASSGQWAIDKRFLSAADGGAVDKGQVNNIQLVFDGARVMRCPRVMQGGIDEIWPDGIKKRQGRVVFAPLFPPDINKAVRLARFVSLRQATIFSPMRVTPIGLPAFTSSDSRMTYH